MKYTHYFRLSIKSAALTTAVFTAMTSSAVTIPNTPLVTQINAKPMVMLIAGKDHKLFYEAYNDTADIDGDGSIDIRFKPAITYYGLFDSNVCYSHNGNSDNNGVFTPESVAGTLNTCSGKWSGNWLNYITSSRIDSLRKVLYGGYREVDSTTETILRRAYIPQDAHSWAKEYTSAMADKYKIDDYTPISEPDSGKRHFFGNLTANAKKDCKDLKDCSDLPPWLSVVKNSSKRVWEWASTERPVLADGTHGGSRKNYTVRIKVCTSTFNNGCKQYGTQYKPIGLLHDYGENNSMLFGLLTGSYDKNMSGGLLRKVVSSFTDEVSSTTGIFSSSAKIVNTFDNLRIRDFNNDRTDQAYKGGWQTTSAMTEGSFPDWGNPVGEMLYEGVRYFSGKSTATSAFTSTGTKDTEVGLSTVAWDDPYSSSSAAKAPRCAKASFLTVSDINPSFDSDQVPGSTFNSFSGDLSALNVTTEANTITANESGVIGQRFIGQSGTGAGSADSAPTAKAVTSLGNIRGLAPEEPTKQGSYYAASVAYFAKRSDLRSDLSGKQNIDTFAVALASPLPRMEVKLPNGRGVTLVPFAKSVGGSSISNVKNDFQPTNQIVDFYVESIANSGTADADSTVNGGRFYAKFRINYEDVEQGADHDMDAIVEYVIKANSDSTVTVTLTPTYQAGGIQHSIGYIISGTTKDGVYLVVQDENVDRPYFLNVPPGKAPGHCNVAIASMPSECKKLPYIGGASPLNKSEVTFTSSTTPSATLLKDPLWYAAKWGGYNDFNNNDKPDQTTEWDSDGNGVPDTYFLVQNPLKLKESLKRAFDSISKISSSGSNVIANSTSLSTNTRIFQARFDASYWSGDLLAYPVTVGSPSVEWRASDKVPAPASRNLVMRTPSGTTVNFLWSNLSSTDKALFDTDPSTTVDNSQDVVDYLRGVRSKELKNSGNFRDRPYHVLGDIAHSSPFYEKDSDAIYVSANDGMLHAFRASNANVANGAGVELFGFIPSEAVSRLKNLTSTGYTHEFFVDGDIVVSPKTPTTGNRNLLFGALGRGGKGLFGLDVTTPTSFSTSNFLWEYTPTGSSTANSDADLGLMLGRPIYAKMNSGAGAVIIGNGYNSNDGKAVLYIFLLNTSGQITEIKKLDTLVGSDNGLATPEVVDADGNGTIDYIYAGDMKGNVWKFDVRGSTPASWSVALSGNPLFTAKSSSNQNQPITAPMSMAVDTVTGDTHEGKRFIFFGTGSYFRTGDPADTAVQTWYGLIDENATITGRPQLRERTFAGSTTISGSAVRSLSAAVTDDMVGKKGWFLDFTFAAGERIVTKSNLFQLKAPTLVGSSIIPAVSDPCLAGGSGFVNFVNPFKGGTTSNVVIDVNKDGLFTPGGDGVPAVIEGGITGNPDGVNFNVGMPGEPTLIKIPPGGSGGGGGGGPDCPAGKRLVCVGGTSDTDPLQCRCVDDVGGLATKGRISWRELIKD